MADFEARRVRRPVPPPPVRPVTAVRTSPAHLPFGNLRGTRVAYTINLTDDIAARLHEYVANSTEGATFGEVAVDAIRECFDRVLEELAPRTDDFFPMRRSSAGRLRRQQVLVRKVFYVTVDEAKAIEEARQRLGGLELGQLHRLALDHFLPR